MTDTRDVTVDEMRALAASFHSIWPPRPTPLAEAILSAAAQIERLQDKLLVERGMNELHRQTAERLTAERDSARADLLRHRQISAERADCLATEIEALRDDLTEANSRATALAAERDALRALLVEARECVWAFVARRGLEGLPTKLSNDLGIRIDALLTEEGEHVG